MDTSHISPSILMGIVAVTLIIGIMLLASLPINLVKTEKRRLDIHKFLNKYEIKKLRKGVL